METYTLTEAEASVYDANNGMTKQRGTLMADLRTRFGRYTTAGETADTEVLHPEGFVVSRHTTVPYV